MFLNGVNHVFLHGTTYSPERAAWPGWKFYASVNFNPNLAIGEDENQLFSYIANCQSLLQEGKPDNETLLYWPIYDVWNTYLKGSLFFQFKIHSLEEWLHHEPFYNTTKGLMQKGYALDFISDNFIAKANVKNNTIQLPGGNYKALVVPTCKYMPLKTLERLIDLKKQGANIIFQDVPESVPGFNNYKEENNKLKLLLENNKTIAQPSKDVFSDLGEANIYPETLVETGLKYIRRDSDGSKIYYLVNHTSKTINQFIPINSESEHVLILDPKSKAYGKAEVKQEKGKTLVKINVKPGDALFLRTGGGSNIENWNYLESTNKTYNIEGDWQISFLHGGPELPDNANMKELVSWTTLGEKAENFSGTAKYEIEFENPDASIKNWALTLGDVRESAKVLVNGNYMGTLWANPFEINIGPLLEGTNTLTLEVTNLSANRIRAKELRGEEWKNFYEINMVNKDYQKFDATKWNPMPSGILGPVTLTALK